MGRGVKEEKHVDRVWFEQYHAESWKDAQFQAWWLEFYGEPTDYSPDAIEVEEYWVRKAFAWMGWNNAKKHCPAQP